MVYIHVYIVYHLLEKHAKKCIYLFVVFFFFFCIQETNHRKESFATTILANQFCAPVLPHVTFTCTMNLCVRAL